jgi:hypothetical protein
VSRFLIAENLINQQLTPIREAFYQYHRLGLDIFIKDATKARQNLIEALETIAEANKIKPASLLMNIFFDVKGQEIVNFLKGAPQEMREKAKNTLLLLDPNKATLYQKLVD